MPKIQVDASVGLPNIVFPITAPGPIPKKNQSKVTIQAVGIRLFLESGSPAYSLKKL